MFKLRTALVALATALFSVSNALTGQSIVVSHGWNSEQLNCPATLNVCF